MYIEGVVLAAGLSSRMGTYKLTLNVRDKTIIESCIESMYNICSKIIVVGGYNFEIISGLLSRYHKIQVIYNPDYREGMFSSVKAGVRCVSADKFFLIPGDHPFVSSETYENMLKMDGDIVIPEYDGRKGHPVLIKSRITDELFSDSTYSSLKEFINFYGFTAIDIQDPGILMDIDTPDDYNNIRVGKLCEIH